MENIKNSRIFYGLQVVYEQNRWTDKEKDILLQYYPISHKDEMIKSLPGRTWRAIKDKAHKLDIEGTRASTNVRILLDNSNKSLYWLGYLMADGHFEQNKIGCSSRDIEHLRKFADYINCNMHVKYRLNDNKKSQRHYGEIHVGDKKTVLALRKKYDIVNRKTYYPPVFFSILDDPSFLCALIGFIDGDGCIYKQKNRNTCILSINLHKSWLNILCDMAERITDITCFHISKPKIISSGQVRLYTANGNLLRYLKKFAQFYDLPFMERKWDKIN